MAFFYQFLFYTHIVAIERMRFFFERNSIDLVWKFEYGFVDSNDDAGVFFFAHWLYNIFTATKYIAKILWPVMRPRKCKHIQGI